MKLKFLTALLTFALSAGAQATVIIDGFGNANTTSATSVVKNVDFTVVGAVVNVSPVYTGLTNLKRQFVVTANGDVGTTITTKDLASSKKLAISDEGGQKGSVKVLYTFTSVNLANLATEFLLNVLSIDTGGVSLKMIANGTSSTAWQQRTTPGNYIDTFASFSDTTVFSHLTSLELDFKGSLASWDASFDQFVTDTVVVRRDAPEPATVLLAGLGLLGVAAARRARKS